MNLIKFHTVDNFETWINPELVTNLYLKEIPDDITVIGWTSFGSTEKCRISKITADRIRYALNNMSIQYPQI